MADGETNTIPDALQQTVESAVEGVELKRALRAKIAEWRERAAFMTRPYQRKPEKSRGAVIAECAEELEEMLDG